MGNTWCPVGLPACPQSPPSLRDTRGRGDVRGAVPVSPGPRAQSRSRARGRGRTLPRQGCLLSPGRVLQPGAGLQPKAAGHGRARCQVTSGDKHVWPRQPDPCGFHMLGRWDVGSQEMGEEEKQLTNCFGGPKGFALDIIRSGQKCEPADFRILPLNAWCSQGSPKPSAKTPLTASKGAIAPLCSPCQAPTPWLPLDPLQASHPRGFSPSIWSRSLR